MALSEKDWELLNAYHDDELSRLDVASLERRLSSEPELAAALESVEQVSDSLRKLSPRTAGSMATTPTNKGLRKWAAGGAVAASLIVGVTFAILSDDESGVHEVHQAFLDQTFAFESGDLRTVAGIAHFPDLGAANLTFVASRTLEAGTAAHYTGRNGCRLTFLSMSSPARVPSHLKMQVQQWSYGENYFAILASGMDHEKFVAIAEYLEEETRKATLPTTVLALREATNNANRCT